MAISDADRLALNEFFKQVAQAGIVRFPIPDIKFGDLLQEIANGTEPVPMTLIGSANSTPLTVTASALQTDSNSTDIQRWKTTTSTDNSNSTGISPAGNLRFGYAGGTGLTWRGAGLLNQNAALLYSDNGYNLSMSTGGGAGDNADKLSFRLGQVEKGSLARPAGASANHYVPDVALGDLLAAISAGSSVLLAQIDCPKIRGSIATSLGAAATGVFSLGTGDQFLASTLSGVFLWSSFEGTVGVPGFLGESLTLKLYRNDGAAQLGNDVVIGTNQAKGFTLVNSSTSNLLLKVTTSYVAGGGPLMGSMGVSVQWEGYPCQRTVVNAKAAGTVTRLWIQNPRTQAPGAETLVLDLYIMRADGVTFDLLGEGTIDPSVPAGSYIEIVPDPAFAHIAAGETILVSLVNYTADPTDTLYLDYVTVGAEITPS